MLLFLVQILFPFLVFFMLICNSCFHFLICALVLKAQLLICTGGSFCCQVCYLLWYCVLLYVFFLADQHLVQCIFLINFLFLLLSSKLYFLPCILLLPRVMFVSFCICMIHLCLFCCCLLLFCCVFLLLFQCLSCSCSLVYYCFCLNIFQITFFSKVLVCYFQKLFIYVCFYRFAIWGIEPYNFSISFFIFAFFCLFS